MSIFHFAFNVTDLDETRAFYGALLGCSEGRSTDTWVDFDFFGHQLSCHLGQPMEVAATGLVGEHKVPMPHFGVVLEHDDWRALADRLTAQGVEFVLAPHTRFAGEPGEQSTMFFLDPAGNPIEIKGLASMASAFAR
ncbi:VOC family protein [uncultured Sulfitobacter sp.]|uniref:VOC family protein n=1 Tax=uncultured Sulfitobacter sp. TaxID=191468 RepID=UPI00261C4B00|nr:VOC family protein [uncultured Sulfitobacter sp.]